MAPRFSVVIPTHNRSALLRLAMSSVFSQTEADFELFVVGDGCTDDTADVVASFDDARIRWLDLPKAPHFGYANRNVALRLAAGEYIAFVTDDDLVFPIISRCLQRAPKNRAPSGFTIGRSGSRPTAWSFLSQAIC